MSRDDKDRARAEAGTPKTLEEAIRFGINIETGGQAHDRCAIAERIEPYIRDYLAQKFGAAMLLADDADTENAVSNLWLAITGRRILI